MREEKNYTEENLVSEDNVTLPEEKPFDKKAMKKDVGRMGWGLILYMVILYGIVVIDVVWHTVWLMLQSPDGILTDQQVETLVMSMEESAVSMIIGVAVGSIFLAVFMSSRVSIRKMFEQRKQMNGKLFLKFLSAFMAVQLVFSYFAELLEMGLNLFGYSAMASIEAASSSSTTISMFVYASFIAPVAEEIVYRGFVMGALQKYGKVFAIVVSSILFGVMHGNIPQAIFAFFVGLVLGYVAMEYSMKWAIAIHMINNFVFAELIGLAGKILGETVEMILSGITIYGFFIAGAVVLWKNRNKIREYVDENRVDRKPYGYGLTVMPVLIFLVVNILIGLMGIQPM